MDERSSVASPPTPESIPSTHGLISSHSSPPDSSTTPSHPITDEERQQMARAWNETLRFPNAAQPEISWAPLPKLASGSREYPKDEVVLIFYLFIYFLKKKPPFGTIPHLHHLTVRAGQKDEYFINTLQDLLESTLGGLVGMWPHHTYQDPTLSTGTERQEVNPGVRWLTRRSHDVRDAARVLYYLLTTLSGQQSMILSLPNSWIRHSRSRLWTMVISLSLSDSRRRILRRCANWCKDW